MAHRDDLIKAIIAQRTRLAIKAAEDAKYYLPPERMRWRLIKEAMLYGVCFFGTLYFPAQYLQDFHGHWMACCLFFGGGLAYTLGVLFSKSYSVASAAPGRPSRKTDQTS